MTQELKDQLIPPQCFIVPPYLLAAIADSDEVPKDARDSAQKTLHHDVAAQKISRDDGANTLPVVGSQSLHASIVPEYLLLNIADSKQISIKERENAQRTLSSLRKLRNSDKPIPANSEISFTTTKAPHLWREVYDANHVDDMDSLPGILLCAEGEESTRSNAHDVVLDECYQNFKHTFDFFYTIFGRDSINNRGLPLVANIHYSTDYDNAYWVPNLRQMVFGDGGQYLCNFTSLDVIAHELVHGITQCTAGLNYQGESGALNESISDVFASMVKQYHLGQDAVDGDWLIGEDCLLPDVKGLALRSLKDPGTAYDKMGFAKDPQPASMSSFVKTAHDHGGVHINSGIPNRAFCLIAIRLGGKSWEKAGRIWYIVLTSNRIKPNCNFKQFADLTCDVAGKRFDSDVRNVVKQAWIDVGVYEGVSFTPVYNSEDKAIGVGGYNLMSIGDRSLALDYDHSGILDHLLFYRPGSGTVSILKYEGSRGIFQPVDSGSEPGTGIGGYDLLSVDDHAFAFDYNHSGKLDHLVFYRPGGRILWILKHEERWTPVYHSREPGKGIGGYDLSSKADRAFAFDYDHSGKLDHIVMHRPGSGIFWILKNMNGVFSSVYRQNGSEAGIGGYDLKSQHDRVIAFDYEHIGKADHLVLCRPGSGKISILKNRDGKFSPVYQQDEGGIGIGGYNLASSADILFSYDFEGTGRLEYLAMYRPGTGTFWLLKNHRGDFSPIYREGDPGSGVGGFDLAFPEDRVFAYNSGKKGTPSQLALYRPGSGIFWIVKTVVRTA